MKKSLISNKNLPWNLIKSSQLVTINNKTTFISLIKFNRSKEKVCLLSLN